MSGLLTLSLQTQFSLGLGSSGFLPARGSLMLDFVVCAMLLVVLVLGVSIYLVRSKRRYGIHRFIQIALAGVLAVAIVAFEIDIRFFTDWRSAAEKSPFYSGGWVQAALWLHLAFAIPTPFIWAYVLVGALKRFRPLEPGQYSQFHRTWGWIASIGMLLTAVTGWLFYYVAFVA